MPKLVKRRKDAEATKERVLCQGLFHVVFKHANHFLGRSQFVEVVNILHIIDFDKTLRQMEYKCFSSFISQDKFIRIK